MAHLIERVIRKTVSVGVMALARYHRGRMPAPAVPHPFLTGLHTPMHDELTLEQLPVRGEIPPGLDGRYVRIGPNPLHVAHPAAHHWFVGDGMVHGLRLQGGRALWYRNRWVRSSAISRALGEDEVPGPRHFSDTVNTNVLALGGRLRALVEAGGWPVTLGDELQTVAHDPFGGSLKGSFSAHPRLDTATGEMHAICYEAEDQGTIRHVVVAPDATVRREEPIAVRHGPSIHDCMVTRQYVIVLDLPVTFSMATLVAGYSFPYVWNPAHRARVGVLRKDAPGSSIVWCEVEPCYVFHACNGFENDDGTLTLDVVAHDTMFEHSKLGPSARVSALERWTVDLAARRVKREAVDTQAQEFPRIDERCTGRPYRWAVTTGLERDGDGQFVSSPRLVRHDLLAGSREVHDFGPDRHAGEFVFQPRRADAAEGDGWWMGFVVDAAAGSTDFVILDAQAFTGAPQATVTLPHRIPAGFHGNWVPDSGVRTAAASVR